MTELGESNDNIPADEMRLAAQLQEASLDWKKPARRIRRLALTGKWWVTRKKRAEYRKNMKEYLANMDAEELKKRMEAAVCAPSD